MDARLRQGKGRIKMTGGRIGDHRGLGLELKRLLQTLDTAVDTGVS